ncbi:uncharacterized protein LOC107462515 [Arachis duranensis]|uniref:Uncharacterized protein LOC107462515 n=1 Tax=Arachis duranensis TaxID=130453 RepID=A0A6P5MSQ5_ARADU|nr:uncharacterized protein LOC107462515 [Arachis duranensis]
MLAYGIAADAVDDYMRIGESTTIECLKKFVEGVISVFDDEYLRKPNSNDILKLHTNIRLLISSLDQDEGEMKKFTNWILDVRNGNIGSVVGDESEIEISDDLLITTTDDPLSYLSRAILAPTLESVEKVNDFVLTIFSGMEKEYLSSDTTCQADENEDVQQEWFTPEFLNDIKYSGLPNHKLTLKPGVAVMLLRNIDQTSGLCNGTRLIVNELGSNVIRATVVTGRNIENKVYIPRMNLIPFRFRVAI